MNNSSFPFRCPSGYMGNYCEIGLSKGISPGTSKFEEDELSGNTSQCLN